MILITGATGLVGSNLLKTLIFQGKEVSILIRKESNLSNINEVLNSGRVKIIYGDITNFQDVKEAVKESEVVYHTAAYVSFKKKDKEEILKTNIGGTENIVNACILNNVKKLCHVSSIAALGNSENGELITEEHKVKSIKNKSVYSKSKFKSELIVWRAAEEGLDTIIVNPSVILGYDKRSGGSMKFFENINKGLKYYTAGGTGFVDVEDLVNIMIKLIETGIKNERFIVNSENVSYKSFLEIVAKNLNKKSPYKKADKKLLKTAMYLEKIKTVLTGVSPKLTKETINSAIKTSKYSNEKIKNVLNCEFINVSESVQRVAKIFLRTINK